MYGLAFAGASYIAHRIYSACTGKTDKLGDEGPLSEALSTNETTNVMQKMRGCWERFTTEEVKNNRGFSALFWQTGETRKANTYRYLVNNNEAKATGTLNEGSKCRVVDRADKAVQFSRQAEHLFCDIAKSCFAGKIHAEDLMYLYAQRDTLRAQAIAEKSTAGPEKIALLCQIQEKIDVINARIKKAEADFKAAVNTHVNYSQHSAFGYKELLKQFQLLELGNQPSEGKYQIEDFIRFYAFKVRLMKDADGSFYTEVKNDFRQYIFCTSAGHLDAGEKLGSKYGKWIKDLLDQSSLGDVDSKSGNLSQRFLQTVYNLLNVGKPNFSLADLCVGDPAPPANRVGNQNFGEFTACSGSYYVTPEGVKIVSDIVAYYKGLAQIRVANNTTGELEHVLAGFDDSKRNTLVWNLLGGSHKVQNSFISKSKMGMFYRVDEQLRKFAPKSEYEMHRKIGDFYDNLGLETFVQTLPAKPYHIRDGNHLFNYTFSKGVGDDNKYSRQLNVLQSIAHRCQLNGLALPDDRRDDAKRAQLSRLRKNYEEILAHAGTHHDSYVAYMREVMTSMGATLYDDFLHVSMENVDLPPNEINLATDRWTMVSDNVATHCINSAIAHKQTLRQQDFKLVIGNDNEVNTHLSIYTATVNQLTDSLRESELCKDMIAIIEGLGELRSVAKFYADIVNNKPQPKEIGLLANPTTSLILTKVAVLDTENKIRVLHARYDALNKKYGENAATANRDNVNQENVDGEEIADLGVQFRAQQKEVLEWSILKTLFSEITSQATDSTHKPKVTTIIDKAIDNCLEKLSSMKYLTLARDNVNALNSRRLLLQLTKQNDMLIQFAKVFSTANADQAVQDELDEFSSNMAMVLADLELQYKKLVSKTDSKVTFEQFNAKCAEVNAWLLKVFLNEGGGSYSNSYSYFGIQSYTLALSRPVAKLCQDNYATLHNAKFRDQEWNSVSLVHQTLLENMLVTKSSTVTKLKLYLGQLFSDGFTYNPATQDIPHFQQLLANYETAILDNLEALSAMGYMHQELLGHYDQIISGVQDLAAISTKVSLHSKLLMAVVAYNAEAPGPGKKFVCELTDDEKKLYLQTLLASNLYKNERNVGNDVVPAPVFDNKENTDTSFKLHSPDQFLDPTQMVSQLLRHLNVSNENNKVMALNTQLTDYATNTANMVREVSAKQEALFTVLKEKKTDVEEIRKGIDQVREKIKHTDKLVVSQDTVQSCDDLLSYYRVPRDGLLEEALSKAKGMMNEIKVRANFAVVNVTKVNMLRLPDIYKQIFFSVFKTMNPSDDAKNIQRAFNEAYKKISESALVGNVALFDDPPMDIEQDNAVFLQEILNVIAKETGKKLSEIEKPLDEHELKNVYEVCKRGKTEDEVLLVRRYLNAFQYKKIEQCLAKFYIGVNENLQTLTDKLAALYELPEHRISTKSMLHESEDNKRQTKSLVDDTHKFLKSAANSTVEWRSSLQQYADHAWLVQPQYDKAQEDQARYFNWFTSNYIKLDIVNQKETTGPLRDELQFLITADYLMTYKVSKDTISEEEIDLIRRFYHNPERIQEDEKKRIQNALTNINTFLGSQYSTTFIKDLITQIQNIFNYVASFFIPKSKLSTEQIQYQLQRLYDLYYLDVINIATLTLNDIRNENNELNKLRNAFNAVCDSENGLTDLFEEVRKVKDADGMFKFFMDYRAGLNGVSDDVLSLLLEAMKNQIRIEEKNKPKIEPISVKSNSKDNNTGSEKPDPIKQLDSVNVHFIRRIVSGDVNLDQMNAETVLAQAEKENVPIEPSVKVNFV